MGAYNSASTHGLGQLDFLRRLAGDGAHGVGEVAPSLASLGVVGSGFAGVDMAGAGALINADVFTVDMSAPLLGALLSSVNSLNTSLVRQLLTFTGGDSTQTFYLSSLLSFEDFGLNAAPAVKELTNKVYSYAANSYASLLAQYAATGHEYGASLYDTVGDLSYIVTSDQSNRLYFDLLANSPLTATTYRNTPTVANPGLHSSWGS